MRFKEGMSIVMRTCLLLCGKLRAIDLRVILRVQFAAEQLIYLIVGWRVAQGADRLQCNMLFQLNDRCADVGHTQVLNWNDDCMLHKNDPRFACHLSECHVPAWIVFVNVQWLILSMLKKLKLLQVTNGRVQKFAFFSNRILVEQMHTPHNRIGRMCCRCGCRFFEKQNGRIVFSIK